MKESIIEWIQDNRESIVIGASILDFLFKGAFYIIVALALLKYLMS